MKMLSNNSTYTNAAPKSQPFHTTIIGTGIAGITLAIALHKRNIPFTLYDQSLHFREIGAGVSFAPNAVRAMELCDPRMIESLNKVATGNTWESKKSIYFEFVDGFTKTEDEKEKPLFKLENMNNDWTQDGSVGCHRAQFLDEMVKLVPEGHTRFGKRLVQIEEFPAGDGEGGKQLKVCFEDGSVEWTDCVIGCDGIKSRVRKIILGEDNPQSYAHYTHKYAYRGLIPMEKAIEALGEDMAGNRHVHAGPKGHILTFPVAKGKLLNVVAFRDDPNPWPDDTKFTLPSKKSDAIADFAGWNQSVEKIMNMLLDELDCWAIFDSLDHPASTYYKGCVCLSGDAAHNTSPHHGSGAAMCIEDSVILAELLLDTRDFAEEGMDTASVLKKAFATFESVRIERTQWVVSSSRKCGNIYDWMDPECGRDPVKSMEELRWRHNKIFQADVSAMIAEAKQVMKERCRSHAS